MIILLVSFLLYIWDLIKIPYLFVRYIIQCKLFKFNKYMHTSAAMHTFSSISMFELQNIQSQITCILIGKYLMLICPTNMWYNSICVRFMFLCFSFAEVLLTLSILYWDGIVCLKKLNNHGLLRIIILVVII